MSHSRRSLFTSSRIAIPFRVNPIRKRGWEKFSLSMEVESGIERSFRRPCRAGHPLEHAQMRWGLVGSLKGALLLLLPLFPMGSLSTRDEGLSRARPYCLPLASSLLLAYSVARIYSRLFSSGRGFKDRLAIRHVFSAGVETLSSQYRYPPRSLPPRYITRRPFPLLPPYPLSLSLRPPSPSLPELR